MNGNEHYRAPSREEIDECIKIEKQITPNSMPLYRECIGDKLMSQRHTALELKDGCRLVRMYKRIFEDA